MDLTEGKIYDVLNQNVWVGEDGVENVSVTIMDDDNVEIIIVNNDEAEYQFKLEGENESNN